MSFGAIPIIGGVAGAVSSFFGGRPKNPYATAMNRASNNVDYTGAQYKNQYGTQQALANAYAPQTQQAVQGYGSYLKSNPWTDQQNNAYRERATAGTNQAYNTGQSNLLANMAARGITGSSADQGGLIALENGRAATLGAAQNNLAMQQAQDRDARLQAFVNLYAGQQQNAQGQANAALGNASGIFQNQQGLYSGLYQNAQAQQQAQDAATFGGLGSALGSLIPGVTNDPLSQLFRRRGTVPINPTVSSSFNLAG